jgi:Cu(I)/Ag(I) efflux system membrane fusion protein
MPGMNLYEIADLKKVWIMFEAYEADIPWIRKGDEVEFTVQANPGKVYRGKVTYIDPFITQSSRVAKVRVEVGNEDGKLLPEMFANGLIRSQLESQTDKLVIPKSAVLWTGKRSIVYVKVPGSRSHAFRYREIELGPDLGDLYVVSSGLKTGEEIATNGVFRIDASAQLSGKKSMMNPTGGTATDDHDHSGQKDKGNRLQASAKIGQAEHFTEGVRPEFKDQFGEVIQSYMMMKNSLVQGDAGETRKAVTDMERRLERVDMEHLEGAAHSAWMADLQELGKSLEGMQDSETIEELRARFSRLSNVLSLAVQKYGWNSGEADVIYLEYCPMANQNNGGYWLSFDDRIRNPYFGEQMLECGEVVQTFSK